MREVREVEHAKFDKFLAYRVRDAALFCENLIKTWRHDPVSYAMLQFAACYVGLVTELYYSDSVDVSTLE